MSTTKPYQEYVRKIDELVSGIVTFLFVEHIEKISGAKSDYVASPLKHIR
jgi:hypothetical protein